MTDDTLTTDDRALLTALVDEKDPLQLIFRVKHYYADMDRAERTPRNYLYFHLGLLAGTIATLTRERRLCHVQDAHTQHYCTRPVGHAGEHIAGIGPYEEGETVLARWPKEDRWGTT